MTLVQVYLQRQRRRYLSFWFLSATFVVAAILFLFAGLRELLERAFEIWNLGPLFFWYFGLGLSATAVLFHVLRRFVSDYQSISLSRIANCIEKESRLASSDRGELRSLAFFLETTSEFKDHPFLKAHEKKLRKQRRSWVVSLSPEPLFYFRFALCLVAAVSFFSLRHFERHLPDDDLAFSLEKLEVLSPASGSMWKKIQGSLSITEGSRLRYENPDLGFAHIYLFQRKSDRLMATACKTICEWEPEASSQMAIGSWLSRSPFMPIRVLRDERPKSFLMAEVKGDFAPDLRLKVRALPFLRFRASASDDVEILSIEFIEKRLARKTLEKEGQDDTTEELETVLHSWGSSLSFREEWVQDFSKKTGGDFHYFLRLRDRQGMSESLPIAISFIDDEEMRKERSLALRAMLDSWVHVLGDLIEIDSGADHEERLFQNLKAISYQAPEESEEKAPLIVAFYGELQRLAERIEREVSNPTRLSTLIQRVERQILYGLSLLFQEKVGSLEESQENLRSTRADLQSLLDKLKKGEMPLDSEHLKEAFKAVAEKIEDLQNKIRELPNGPTDDMINKEALQNQLDESESLEARIAEIQKQIESGKSEAALKELESLLNQLSLLTKEMENSLSQWKDNFDKGSQTAVQNYQKSIEELKKKQEKLSQASEALKKKIDAEKQELAQNWKAPDSKKEEKLAEEARKLSDQQSELQKDFQNARESLEQQLGESEWRDLFRSEDIQSLEEKAQTMMQSSKDALKKRMVRDSIADQQSVIDSLKKIQESTKNKQKQIQNQAQAQAQQKKERQKVHVDVLSNESSGDRERRRKILDSLQQNIDERYQKSHERYFEELLQR